MGVVVVGVGGGGGGGGSFSQTYLVLDQNLSRLFEIESKTVFIKFVLYFFLSF